MTHRIGNMVFIQPQDPEKCEECGENKECRPYGRNGMNVCFDCFLIQFPKQEDRDKQMELKMFGNNPKTS